MTSCVHPKFVETGLANQIFGTRPNPGSFNCLMPYI
jgi:hypothetical protein